MQILFDVTAFLVASSIAYATAMWGSVWRLKYPVPLWDVSKIFTIAFSLQLLIYIIFSFIIVDIRLRIYLARFSIIVICLSQAIPLTIAYRVWKHESRGT